MIMATNRALALVRSMPLEERRMILDFFDQHAPSTDPIWTKHACWEVPATELDVALRLVAERGY